MYILTMTQTICCENNNIKPIQDNDCDNYIPPHKRTNFQLGEIIKYDNDKTATDIIQNFYFPYPSRVFFVDYGHRTADTGKHQILIKSIYDVCGATNLYHMNNFITYFLKYKYDYFVFTCYHNIFRNMIEFNFNNETTKKNIITGEIESAANCAIRCLNEELGLDCEIENLYQVRKPFEYNNHKYSIYNVSEHNLFPNSQNKISDDWQDIVRKKNTDTNCNNINNPVVDDVVPKSSVFIHMQENKIHSFLEKIDYNNISQDVDGIVGICAIKGIDVIRFIKKFIKKKTENKNCRSPILLKREKFD